MITKLGSGLLFRDFLDDSSLLKRTKLRDSGLIDFIQIIPDIDFFSKNEKYVERVLNSAISFSRETKLKFLVHLPSENVGVDLGEALDWNGAFLEYSSKKKITWRSFNEKNISLCLKVIEVLERSGCLVSNLRIAHPGYGASYEDSLSLSKILGHLRDKDNIALETLPVLVKKKKTDRPIWGFGALPESMKNLISKLPGTIPMLDFTHLNVSANIISNSGLSSFVPKSLRFKTAESAYRMLIDEMESLKPCNVFHVGGFTSSTEDSCYSFGNEPRWFIDVTSEVLGKFPKRLIALEINYDDPIYAEQQICHFRDKYL